MMKKNMIFVSSIDPQGGRGGEYLRVLNLLRLLSESWNVILFRPGVERVVIEGVPSYGYQPNYNMGDLGVFETVKMCWTANVSLVSKLCSVVRDNNISLVWWDYLYWGKSVDLLRSNVSANVRMIWGTHNVQSRITICQGAKNPKVWFRFMIERLHELHYVKKYDSVVAVSDLDSVFFKNLGCQNIRVVPNFIYPCYLRNELGVTRGQYAVLIGNFNAIQNLNAAMWFCNKVMPLVLLKCPDFKLLIAGQGSEKVKVKLTSVRVHGAFHALSEVLDNARLSIVPILEGSGSRLKVAESLASRIPLVSTTLGIEGVSLTPGKHVLIGNTPEEFAVGVGRIWGDVQLASTIAASGYDFYCRNYSPQRLLALVEDL